MLKKIILLAMIAGLSACVVNDSQYSLQQENIPNKVDDFFKQKIEMSDFDITYDKLENIHFIQNSFDTASVNSLNTNCGTIILSPYIGLSSDYGWLRFKLKYNNNKWLFIQKIKFYINNEKKEYNFTSDFIKQDIISSALITEKFDTNDEFFVNIVKEFPNKGEV